MTLTSVLIVSLIAVQALHLLEEIKTGFRRESPLGEIPCSLFVGINAFVYSFSFATLALSVVGHPIADPLAWALAVGAMANGLGHVLAMMLVRRYLPGGLTAMPLAAVAAGLAVALATGA